jgi:serine/threonine-protein kinase
LGKYRVLEPLGRGGMARVYRAYHPRLDRYVAIKVMRPDLVEETEFLARFQREARAVAALRHPNIVQVYDFDVEDEIYYMVMELMEGDTLKARLTDYRIQGERMAWGEMVRIILDVLDGLAYAHSERIIHRDIKPANILLTRRGEAVIGDFGITHIIGGTRHTERGALIGTLEYMAPEQGMTGRCDAYSDIYSLGIVFYEMLTQRTPFDADTPLAVLMKHINDPLPLPRQIDPEIPEPLERVVLKALTKRPEDRYRSAREMAQTLEAAAEEAGLELPARISQPLSFTTEASSSESVAVISGTTRQFIADAAFADDETDAQLGQKLAAERAARAAQAETEQQERQEATPEETSLRSDVQAARARIERGARVVLARSREALRYVRAALGAPLADDAAADREPSEATEMPNLTVMQAILASLASTGAFNLLILTLAAVTGRWRIFEVGWPAELFLGAITFSFLMYALGTIWLLIPIGAIFGTGVLMAYSAITGYWEHWNFLWLFEIWFPALAVMTAIYFSRRHRDLPTLSRHLAWLVGVAAAALALLTLVMAALGLWPFLVLVSVGLVALWLLNRR